MKLLLLKTKFSFYQRKIQLSNLNELENPIHIAIDKEKKGRLLVD